MARVLQGELFDDTEMERCTRITREMYEERLRKLRAEFYRTCDIPHFPEPKTDNERLLEYQHRWLKCADGNAKAELFALGWEIIRRIIWHRLKARKGGRFLNKEAQQEMQGVAFEYVFSRYESGKGYVVRKNFISALKYSVKHAMEYRTMADETGSLSDIGEDARILRRF